MRIFDGGWGIWDFHWHVPKHLDKQNKKKTFKDNSKEESRKVSDNSIKRHTVKTVGVGGWGIKEYFYNMQIQFFLFITSLKSRRRSVGLKF